MPIPDLQSGPTYDGQSVQDSTDLAATSATAAGTGIISGCVVSALASPGFAVQVSAGAALVNGTYVTVASVGSVTIANPSSSDCRDVVTVNSAGAVSVTAGTPCGTANWSRTSGALPPVKPAIPLNSVFLADIYVSASASSLTNADIEVNTTTLNAGPFVVSVPGTGADGIHINFAENSLNGQGLAVFNYLAELIFSIPSSGGPIVYGDHLGAAYNGLGEEISFDGTTNPPSFYLPNGTRIWGGAGMPASVIAVGTVNINDKYLNGTNGLWYNATAGGTPGTWASDALFQLSSLFTGAGQLAVGTGSNSVEFLAAGSVGTVLTSNGTNSVPSWQPSTGGGGSASAGVSSFNTRSGAVTLVASDIESTFASPGQIYVGTGTNAGELLAPSIAGLVLTSNGVASVPSWQAASVVSGLVYVGATDYSQAVTTTAASVNLHAGIGIFVDALGADPTGATDSTAAFNAALQAVSAASVGYVRLGVGSYLIGTNVTTTTTTTGNVSASCPATFKLASTTGWYNGFGNFSVVTSSGVAIIKYTGISGASVTNCVYAGGATGSIASGASVTMSVGNFGHGQGIIGPGSQLTTINSKGPGIALFMADNVYAASVSEAAPARGFSIVGTSSGYAGFVFGNLDYARVNDVNISGFTGTTGAGFFLAGEGANYGSWIDCIATNNTENVLIGLSHNFSEYDFTIIANASQNGFVAYANASLVGCHIRVRGTFNTGVSSNTGIALLIGNGSSDATTVTNSTYDFSVVTNGTGIAHQSLSVNVAASVGCGIYGTGLLSFETVGSSSPFTAATGFSGNVGISGYVNVPGIGTMSQDALAVAGGSLWQTAGGATTALSGGNILLDLGDTQIWQLASGANTWAFLNGPSSSNLFSKQISLYVVQPTSGSVGTLSWPANVIWASGAAPVLSIANSAVDTFRFTYLPQTNKWYGSYGPGSASDRGSRVLSLSSNSATPSINTDSYSVVHITGQTAAITSFTSGLQGHPQDGNELRVSITGTTSVALTWGASFESSGGTTLPSTTSGTTRLDVAFVWNTETSKWRCVGAS